MSGIKIEISVIDMPVRAALDRLFLATNDLTEPMERAGEYMLGSTRDRAALEVDPDGIQWAPLNPDYAEWKRKKRPGAPILVFDRHMLGDQLSYQAGATFVRIGTSAIYGARHQLGPAGVPGTGKSGGARPFLGVSAEDRPVLIDIFGSYIKTAAQP